MCYTVLVVSVFAARHFAVSAARDFEQTQLANVSSTLIPTSRFSLSGLGAYKRLRPDAV
jgi:hypothetical protein